MRNGNNDAHSVACSISFLKTLFQGATMKHKIPLLLIAVVLILMSITPVIAQDEFVFGMVLVGPKDDRGWSQAHFEGGQYVVDNVEGAEMLYFESLNSADKPETTLADVVELFVDEGAELIITTSDAFEEDTVAVAEEYPDVTFINVSGDDVLTGEAPENMGNVMAMSEWPRLIAGCAAALTTETGQLGYIGPLINAETRRVAASAYLGARYCWENYRMEDPADLTFEITWIGFWFAIPGVTLDTTEESHAFFDRGFDVVMSGLDTTEMVVVAGQRAAEGETVFSMAYNSKQGCDQAPETCLGVPFYHWGTTYLPMVAEVIDGTWEQSWDWVTPYFEDLADEALNITGYQVGDGLSAENAELLDEFIVELTEYALDEANADTIFLWEGPLSLQDGTVLAEEGEPVAMTDIWYLEQLLDGMVGASSTD
jgi:simple sugar transport system substrate-binding protein